MLKLSMHTMVKMIDEDQKPGKQDMVAVQVVSGQYTSPVHLILNNASRAVASRFTHA